MLIYRYLRRFPPLTINNNINKLVPGLLLRYNSSHNSTNAHDDLIDREYQSLIEEYLPTTVGHKCFIIHPYVKWGPQKIRDVTPIGQLEEAVALINTLDSWKVVDKIAVPLESMDRKVLFGTGTMKKLQETVRKNPNVTSVFINMDYLKMARLEELEEIFAVPIFDRYNIVMQILRLHAISKHAKLQVALAELPYVRARLKKFDGTFVAGGDHDTRRLMLQNREQKLKDAIKKLRSQRELLRNRRIKVSYPIVAVVGYTNAGKTSLIKSLTGDQSLEPKDQLFATLDVTLHNGVLPSNLNVLYVDTVGFLSNIPTGLIECFIATLEDAILADVILHVEDLSSPNFLHQRKHVLNTLKSLGERMGSANVLDKLLSIGNKCDIQNTNAEVDYGENYLRISATKELGVDLLRQMLEKEIIKHTNRHVITLNLPIGGDEIRWLYKNATVVSTTEDRSNTENHNVKVIITASQLGQFKHIFC